MRKKNKRWLWLAVIAMSMVLGYGIGKFIEVKLMADTYVYEAY